ncbi:hypothetical protein [Streptomyces sp. NPDC002758]
MPHVDIIVTDELLDDFTEKGLPLLQAREVSRTAAEPGRSRITLDMPYAPEGAQLVDPIFQRTPDGVRVLSLGWTYAA